MCWSRNWPTGSRARSARRSPNASCARPSSTIRSPPPSPRSRRPTRRSSQRHQAAVQAGARPGMAGCHRGGRGQVEQMTASRVADALAGRPVKPSGGNLLVCCPAHDDNVAVAVALRRRRRQSPIVSRATTRSTFSTRSAPGSIARLNLPTRPTKSSDTRAKSLGRWRRKRRAGRDRTRRAARVGARLY